jgi:uncharacterized repeat protein (TIGR01451 family)
MRKFIQSWWNSNDTKRKQRRKNRRRTSLRLEPLENRQLLAITNMAGIGGAVFDDLTDDGLTVDDNLVSGVTVNLFLDGGNATFESGGGDDTLMGSTTTNASGEYEFTGLAAGDYFVQQIAPSGFIQKTNPLFSAVTISSTDAEGVFGTTIDSFDGTEQSVIVGAPGMLTNSSSETYSDTVVVGSERDIFVELTSATGMATITSNSAFFAGVLDMTAGAGSQARYTVSWDGTDGDATNLDETGLRNGGATGVDFTDADASIGFKFLAGVDKAGQTAEIRVFTDSSNHSSATINLTNTGGLPDDEIFVAFTDFTTTGGTGADFSDVGAVELEIEATVDAMQGQFELVGSLGPTPKTANFANFQPLTLGDQVFNDSNNNGVFDSGTESGVSGVLVNLYTDTNGSNDYTDGVDTFVTSDTTDGSGQFLFDELFPGNYIVQLAESNFQTGQVLDGFQTSAASAADPDVDSTDGDDNGDELMGFGVVSPAITLQADTEPTTDGDSDPDTNLAVDFGVLEISDLSVTKTDTSDPVTAGEQLVYEIVVTNNGPSDATGVTVTDPLPTGVTYDSGSSTAGSVSQNAGTVTAAIGNLANGDTATVTVTVDVDAPTVGPLSNTATVSGDQHDSVTANNTATEPTNIDRIADLQVTKTDSVDPVVAGNQLIYTLLVTNNGPSTATGVVATDTLPSDVQYVTSTSSVGSTAEASGVVTATIGDLAVGGTATVTVTVDVDSDTTATLSNSATVAGNESDDNPNNDIAVEPTSVSQEVDVQIVKSESTDPVGAGGILVYTLDVTNAGPSDATGVTVFDTLPAGVTYTTGSVTQGSVSESTGVVTATIGNLVNGQTESVTVNVAVGAGVTGILSNTATVASNETETDSSNNTDTEDTVVSVEADLGITKSDSPDPVVADGALVYTIIVTNNGPADATGVTVTDTLPAGVTYDTGSADQGTVSESAGTVTADIGNIAVGNSVTVTLNIDVDSSTLGTITNQANVAGNEVDTVSANDDASVSTTVQPEIDLVVTKADSVDPVVAGQTLTYTLDVTNNGPSDATSVVMTDVLPAGVTYQTSSATQGTTAESSGTVTATIGNIAAGATETVTIEVLVVASTTGTLTNTANATGAETESNSANNSASEDTTIAREIDLAITKTAVPNPVAAGNSLSYTIVVTNNGPSDASGVTVTDVLPGEVTYGTGSSTVGTVSNSSGTVTGTIGDLAVGASATVTINVDVDSIVVADITNTASVTGNETDLITVNDTASVATSINLDPASVNGRVFIDRDNDGLFNNRDIALNNIDVRLTGTDVRGAAVDTTLQTDANGLYSFTNIVPGDYVLTETQPTSFPDGQTILGSPAIGLSTPNEITQLLLGPGVNVDDVLFTELVPTISKRNFLASNF